MKTNSSPRILVTGDAGPDFDIYLHSDADNPPSGTPPTVLKCSPGGTGLAHRILCEWAGDAVAIGFLPPSIPAPPTFAVWHPVPWGKATLNRGRRGKNVWRVKRSLSAGEIHSQIPLPPVSFPPAPEKNFQPDVVLIVDNGASFRHPKGAVLPHEKAWKNPNTMVVWKMALPLCRGELWWRALENNVLDRMVVVVPLECLRKESTRISERISWERTALEIARALDRSPSLADLRSVANIIVTIHGEGALWLHSSKGRTNFTLFFDPAHMEREWWKATGAEGGAYGYQAAFSATLAACIAESSNSEEGIRTAIPRGLLAMRILHAWGHGPVANPTPAFPAQMLADVARKGLDVLDESERLHFGIFSEVSIPQEEVEIIDSRWRIVLTGGIRPADEPLYGLARRVAIYGEQQLRGVPHARFGQLLTADRGEIEALRNLKTLIENYEKSVDTKPLSLAVFGPPGAGKSFGVKQIAKEIFSHRCAILEFNLSQFDDNDLAGALHQVRDKVLEGFTPVVFWDEFDSNHYHWLQFLLAPMNDGKFQEGQITHPIGHCVFVFAGGTSNDMEHFGPPRPEADSDTKAMNAWEEFKLLKGPDFISRIHGSLNVLGPNRRTIQSLGSSQTTDDPGDVCFPLRRAILLRALLGLKEDERLEMDSGLLSALLETSKYSNGARSFEKICVALGRKKDHYRLSQLPSDAVLAMNISDLAEFKALIVRDEDFKEKAPHLAKAFHDVWRTGKRKQKGTESFDYDCDFEKLPINKRNDNICAAMRMPRNLLLGGLFLVPAKEAGNNKVSEIPNDLVEIMAQEEHIQWLENAVADGFRQKRDEEKRDDINLVHECILPWNDLPDGQREYDRWFIQNYPVFAEKAGFSIVASRPK